MSGSVERFVASFPAAVGVAWIALATTPHAQGVIAPPSDDMLFVVEASGTLRVPSVGEFLLFD